MAEGEGDGFFISRVIIALDFEGLAIGVDSLVIAVSDIDAFLIFREE